ncbi:hypothetical protein ES706_03723 [subsurface metagenome]
MKLVTISVAMVLLLICAGAACADGGFVITYPPGLDELSLEVGSPQEVDVHLKNNLEKEVTIRVSDNANGVTRESIISIEYPAKFNILPGKSETLYLTINPLFGGDFNVAVHISVETPEEVDGMGGEVLIGTSIFLGGDVFPQIAEFVVENLEITPEVVYPGEEVTISVDVANIGGTAGSKLIKLEIDGAVADSKSVVLDPSESKSVSFTVVETEPDNYEVSVDGLTGSFEVVPLPVAEVVVENLEITPEVVYPGEEVTISVDVANVGTVWGGYTVELKIEGEVVDSETVTLDPGEAKRASFTVYREAEGTYVVQVDGLAGSFEVVAPPAGVPSLLVGVIIAVIATICGVLYWRRRRRRSSG